MRLLLNWRGGNFRGCAARVALNLREYQNSLRFQLQQKGAASAFSESSDSTYYASEETDQRNRNVETAGFPLKRTGTNQPEEQCNECVFYDRRRNNAVGLLVKLLGVLMHNLLVVVHGAALYTAAGEVSTA